MIFSEPTRLVEFPWIRVVSDEVPAAPEAVAVCRR